MTTNVRHTIAPLPIDLIKEYFQDKSILFLVDYENSKLQDKIFLTYLSNLDIPADIELRNEFPLEKTFSLIESYMQIKTVSDVEFLTMIVCHILLRAKGVDIKDAMENTFLTDEQADQFIEQHKELVDRWVHFLDSSFLYLIYSFKDLNDQLKVEENYPKIEDPNYVGLNVVNLFSVPGFMNCYFASAPTGDMSFFVDQFTKYMFKGKSFFEYYKTEQNTFIPILLAMVDDLIPVDAEELFKD